MAEARVVQMSVLRGFEVAKAEIDANVEEAYSSVLNTLRTNPHDPNSRMPSAVDLRDSVLVVGYLATHKDVCTENQTYLAAHWENAIRERNRLGKLPLVDTHLPNVLEVDQTLVME